jgi:F-type H+-transporting ATPase subunit b
MRKTLATCLLVLSPGAAMAASNMPQMNFSNPLTSTQVIWMAVIMVVLYFVLSRWGLPEMGKVLENRAQVIARDLADAHAAKAAADQSVKAMNATMRQARTAAQAEIARAVGQAKEQASQDAARSNAILEKRLAEAEAQIAAARAAALAAIKPVAESSAAAMLGRLTGAEPDEANLQSSVATALAARKAA